MYRNLSLENIENEIWKDIEGYEGRYQVSNMGRVTSLNYKGHKSEVRILKQSFNDNDYLTVMLYKDGKMKKIRVHRLVAQTFIENIGDKPCVDHISTVKTDNRAENLRFVTHKENMNNELTKEKMKLSKTRKGRKNPNYKGFICIFSNGEVTKEMTVKEIGELLGVSGRVVIRIAKSNKPYKPRNKKNKHLDGIRIFYADNYLKLESGDNNVA